MLVMSFTPRVDVHQKIQESFNKQQEMQEDQGNRDILKIFARISTSQNQKMSECDKIQLSYFIHNQSDKIKSKRHTTTPDQSNLAEAYYCTKNGKAKGILTLTEHLIMFDPVKCVENEGFVRPNSNISVQKDLKKYQAIIDLQDIVQVQKIRTESDSQQFITNPDIKKYYQYTYYIQINLASVNGVKLDSAASPQGKWEEIGHQKNNHYRQLQMDAKGESSEGDDQDLDDAKDWLIVEEKKEEDVYRP